MTPPPAAAARDACDHPPGIGPLRPMAAALTCRSSARPARLLAAALSWLWRGLERRRQRQRLALLDARMLRDIGVSGTEARHEAALPMWNPPLHWRAK